MCMSVLGLKMDDFMAGFMWGVLASAIVFIFVFLLVSPFLDFSDAEEDKDVPEISTQISFEELLEQKGLQLTCKEFEQIRVTKFNTTCGEYNLCGGGFFGDECTNVPQTSYIEDSEKECLFGGIISVEPVITNINGECLRYEIIKK